jgi:hypothetical protein
MAMGMVQAFFYQQKLTWGEFEIVAESSQTKLLRAIELLGTEVAPALREESI